MMFCSAKTCHLICADGSLSFRSTTSTTETVQLGDQSNVGAVPEPTVMAGGKSQPPPPGVVESPQDATTSASDASMG
jgi:hypothetical protein